MAFAKPDMQAELGSFLRRFGEHFAVLYGLRDASFSAADKIEESLLWKTASAMYDYGVTGIASDELRPGRILDGLYAQIEKFFRAFDTPAMKIYLADLETSPPRLAIRAVQVAVARLVLDGGGRATDYGIEDHGLGEGDSGFLTLAEVALLANMDERSVRNAANPKLPDPLKTEQVGKRSLVTPEEARRWLANRKGFTPTKNLDLPAASPQPTFNVTLPPEFLQVIEQIQREADEAGVPRGVYFKERIVSLLVEAMEAQEKGEKK